MNKSNPIVAMHLLLATETFDSTTLKVLANMDQSELRNNLAIQRLEAMFNTCKKYDKLVNDSTLKYFPGHQTVAFKRKTKQLNMLEFAEALTEDPCDKYCVVSTMQCIAQILRFRYEIDDLAEKALNDAIQKNFNIECIRSQLSNTFLTASFDKHYDFPNGLQKVINYVKRDEQAYVIRPNAVFNSMSEFDIARAYRYSDYARYSLHTLGEALAMTCPIWIAAVTGDRDYNFEDFMLDFPIVDIIKLYIEEARETYGDCESEEALLEKLQTNPSIFYDPEEEPRCGEFEPGDKEDLSGTIRDIKNDFPDIARILFEDFSFISVQ